jgi:hypothetical protein
VYERQFPGNEEACPEDCSFPFISCPGSYSSSSTGGADTLLPCSGRGVCYTSLGVCDCYAGWMGADCSTCSSGHVSVKGSCVAASRLVRAPATGGNRTRPAGAVAVGVLSQSWQLGVVFGVLGGCMLLMVGVAVVVHRLQRQQHLALNRQTVAAKAAQRVD